MIEAKVEGVGEFEGAKYCEKGAIRPTERSLMKSLG